MAWPSRVRTAAHAGHGRADAPALTTWAALDDRRRARSRRPDPKYRQTIASIEELLASTRTSLNRVSAQEAAQLSDAGALLVDIRPFEQRSRDGEIPGALVIDRNVFEWRLDPASAHRVPEIRGYDQMIIVVCNEGYASSLAARSLQDLGLRRATDLIDGFVAWRAAGLPVELPRR